MRLCSSVDTDQHRRDRLRDPPWLGEGVAPQDTLVDRRRPFIHTPFSNASPSRSTLHHQSISSSQSSRNPFPPPTSGSSASTLGRRWTHFTPGRLYALGAERVERVHSTAWNEMAEFQHRYVGSTAETGSMGVDARHGV